MELMAVLLFLCVCLFLLAGFPVAFTLGGTALAFAYIGGVTDTFDEAFVEALPNRLYGIMTNVTLLAVPLFVFMGVMLEKSRVAEKLLESTALLLGNRQGGIALSVVLVGALLAASTGIVGATVVTMGLLSLPLMMKRGYDPAIACGTICASGTLGQIIPPSIILILLGDVLSSAYQQAQLDQGIFSPETLSISDLFAGALVPGVVLVIAYMLYLLLRARLHPQTMPASSQKETTDASVLAILLRGLLPPLLLIIAVLGSIIMGAATPTEAASVGAVGAMLLAWKERKLNMTILREVSEQTLLVTSMVFMILIGASIFSLVFRGFGGDEMIQEFLAQLPGGKYTALLLVMLVMFLLGFVLDFIEITFVVVPIVGPVLLSMDINPVWLGILIALNLQTSFLTPPFGFALFYLRGVAPPEVNTSAIYRGVVPFIIIQLLVIGLIIIFPGLASWLPDLLNQSESTF